MNITITIDDSNSDGVLEAFAARFPAVYELVSETDQPKHNEDGSLVVDRTATLHKAIEEFVVGNVRDYKMDQAATQARQSVESLQVQVN